MSKISPEFHGTPDTPTSNPSLPRNTFRNRM